MDLASRHYGVTSARGNSYSEAARVCLQQHHTSPQIFLVKQRDLDPSEYTVSWIEPDERTKAAWNNNTERTENGACCLVIASCEIELRLFAVKRAETGTGADYYLSTDPKPVDLEDSIRLEISGTDLGDEKAIHARLKKKVTQTLKGSASEPAIAGVAGFKAKLVALSRLELGDK